MKHPMSPLMFEPLLRRAIWGGRRLESLLFKSLGQGHDFAESWEVVDHGPDQSVVANGPWRGWTLGQLVAQHGPRLLGRHHPQARFPLLFKFLDAHQHLSVQVHPDDAAAARLDPPDLGKTEAWVILHADPGSRVYAGLKPGLDRAAVERAMHHGAIEHCLHEFEPRVGDCLFIPAGTVHALGAGLVVAEIQQSSDTTFRLYDWNRLGADGTPRPLHIEVALDAIDYQRGPIAPHRPSATGHPLVRRLVECDKFVLDRWDLPATWKEPAMGPPRTDLPDQDACCGGDDRFHILSVLEGEATLEFGGEPLTLTRGQTLLLPACLPPLPLYASGSATPGPLTMLDMYLP